MNASIDTAIDNARQADAIVATFRLLLLIELGKQYPLSPIALASLAEARDQVCAVVHHADEILQPRKRRRRAA